MSLTLCGWCSLLAKHKFKLVFSRIEEVWWHSYISGFNHCYIAIQCGFGFVTFNPLVNRLSTSMGFVQDFRHLDHLFLEFSNDILEITVRPTKKNKLIGIKPQSCATLIQYICGFDVGAIRVQRLYDILTTKDTKWLSKKGILEVKKWEPSTTL
jgi:hypothetical protein